MIDVISCGRDHRRGGCSKNSWTVKVWSKHFDGPPVRIPCFFFYLFCYIKEDSQEILLFCLVWSVFASIRDMLPIRVIWFLYVVMGITKNGSSLRFGGNIKSNMSWCLGRPDQPTPLQTEDICWSQYTSVNPLETVVNIFIDTGFDTKYMTHGRPLENFWFLD